MIKPVYLIPGFGASDLGIAASGQVLWWNLEFAALTGLGGMRLAPNGMDPQPPDGVPIGVARLPQDPWPEIKTQLDSQLDIGTWKTTVVNFDWRFDLVRTAGQVADLVRSTATAGNPATLVGHSAGGLVSVLAWANLAGSGQTSLVRRIITLCAPFQGSYAPIGWLNGTLATMQQLLGTYGYAVRIAANLGRFWVIDYLNRLAFTWPSFYQLMPSLLGSDAQGDPFRANLYSAGNYPPGFNPDSGWLANAEQIFQPLMISSQTFPPQWVLTCVFCGGISTVYRLASGSLPIDLNSLDQSLSGDGIVTTESQIRRPSKLVEVTGTHPSVPLGLARSGVLAELISDPRGPLSPPPPPLKVTTPISQNVTDPPQAEPVTGLVCIGGG